MNLQHLPDLAQSFAKIRLAEMIAWNKDRSLFAETCRASVHTDYRSVVQMIQDQLRDNAPLTVDLMGAATILLLDELHGSCLTPYQLWQLRRHGRLIETCEPLAWNGAVRNYAAEAREMEEMGYEMSNQ